MQEGGVTAVEQPVAAVDMVEDGAEAAPGHQAFEQRLAAVAWAEWPADDVVLDVLRQRREHAFDIIARLETEMLVELRVHHLASQHGSRPSRIRRESHNEILVSCKRGWTQVESGANRARP